MTKIVLSGCIILSENNEILLLFRPDHGHYETPGGKVNPDECEDVNNPTISELRNTALRELHEELGYDFKAAPLEFFERVEFKLANKALVANKFLTTIISGTPTINEPDIFTKMDYLPVNKLESYPISPDLKLLLPKLKEYISP